MSTTSTEDNAGGAPVVDRRKNPVKRWWYKLAHIGLIDADFKTVMRRIVQLEVLGFAAIIGVSWINEVWGLPNLIYGGPPPVRNYHEAFFETGWALLIMAFVLIITRTLLKEIRHLDGYMPVCHLCKSIRHTEEEWVRLEDFLRERSNVKVTHSICPRCSTQHYGQYGSRR